MDALTRPETLRVLRAMGIDLPDDTRLSDDLLDKRLRDALNASQYKDRFPDSLDWNALPPWSEKKPEDSDRTARTLLEAVQRGNMHEARLNVEAKAAGKSAVPPLYVDPFMDLRQTITGIAKGLDEGYNCCVLLDPGREKYTINIRIISVRKLDDKTPAIFLLYRSFKPSTATKGEAWVHDQIQSNGVKGVPQVIATTLEQKLFMKIFKLNAPLVPSDMEIDRLPGEEQFKASVLLPVGPLEYAARTKLNNNQGCILCGQKAVSRCSQCQSVFYCGADCQRADWPQHKQTCRSIRGGRWCTISTKPSFPGTKDMYMSMLNKFSSASLGFSDKLSAPYKIDSSTPPPNAWGERTFLIKLQVGLGSTVPGHMMIYDKKRSFQVLMLRADNDDVFDDFYLEMVGPRGGHEGLKMYRWAKRTGDWELSVCLDRQPPATETNW